MAELSIRKAVSGDEQVLAYIQTESWKAAFAGILSPEELVRCTNLEKAELTYMFHYFTSVQRIAVLFSNCTFSFS